MWHRPLLYVSYLPIQVLKTSLVFTAFFKVSHLFFQITAIAVIPIFQDLRKDPDPGGFQLLDLIISELKSHMTH